MDYASYKMNENLEGKRKIIDYKVPSINKEVKREGKAFVSKGLLEFEQLSSSPKNRQELAPHFEVLMNFISDIGKKIRSKVDEILDKFDKITINPSSKNTYKDFFDSLVSYKDCYELIHKIDYAIEWIGKRIDFISNEEDKEELFSIQKGLIESKSFHESAQRLVYQLIEVTKVLIENGMTPEVANQLVLLIIQLKELSFEDDKKRVTLSIWDKVSTFYQRISQSMVSLFNQIYLLLI